MHNTLALASAPKQQTTDHRLPSSLALGVRPAGCGDLACQQGTDLAQGLQVVYVGGERGEGDGWYLRMSSGEALAQRLLASDAAETICLQTQQPRC